MKEEGLAVQEALFRLTKQRTVPNVFIGGQHIGGFDRTSELKNNGELEKLIKNSKNLYGHDNQEL